jgi:SAM-dependent methyltransferase
MSEIADFWDKAPCEAWHGTAPVGSMWWSQQISAQRYFVQPHIREFADFPRWRGKYVLEIGCGIGTDAIEFARAGAMVVGTDASMESIRLARTRRELIGRLGNAQFFLAYSNGELEQEQSAVPFDLVYSFGVLHHTPHPETVLQNAHKYLKHSGELRIMLYAKYSLKHLFRRQPEASAGCPLVRWYSMREAKRLVESSGFRVTSIEKRHIFPWRIKKYRQHRYRKAFPWNIIPEEWFERYLGHHILVKAVKA